MLSFIGHSQDVVQFVKELVMSSGIDYRLTTITLPGRSEVYSARIVIDTSSEDTVKTLAWEHSLTLLPISTESIQAG